MTNNNNAPDRVWIVSYSDLPSKCFTSEEGAKLNSRLTAGFYCGEYTPAATHDALQQDHVTLQICFDKVAKERDALKHDNERLLNAFAECEAEKAAELQAANDRLLQVGIQREIDDQLYGALFLERDALAAKLAQVEQERDKAILDQNYNGLLVVEERRKLAQVEAERDALKDDKQRLIARHDALVARCDAARAELAAEQSDAALVWNVVMSFMDREERSDFVKQVRERRNAAMQPKENTDE